MIARGNSGLGNKERPKESQISAKASRLKKKNILSYLSSHLHARNSKKVLFNWTRDSCFNHDSKAATVFRKKCKESYSPFAGHSPACSLLSEYFFARFKAYQISQSISEKLNLLFNDFSFPEALEKKVVDK